MAGWYSFKCLDDGARHAYISHIKQRLKNSSQIIRPRRALFTLSCAFVASVIKFKSKRNPLRILFPSASPAVAPLVLREKRDKTRSKMSRAEYENWLLLPVSSSNSSVLFSLSLSLSTPERSWRKRGNAN